MIPWLSLWLKAKSLPTLTRPVHRRLMALQMPAWDSSDINTADNSMVLQLLSKTCHVYLIKGQQSFSKHQQATPNRHNLFCKRHLSNIQMVLMFFPHLNKLTDPAYKRCRAALSKVSVFEVPAERLPSRLLPAVCQAAALHETSCALWGGKGTQFWPSAEEHSTRRALESFIEVK